jgi:hypothetical protein
MLARCAGIALCLTFLAGIARAGEPPGLPRSGTYEVQAKLLLPHLGAAVTGTTTMVCLPRAPAGEPPFPILSPNNPFADCPARNLESSAGRLQYDIVCQGRGSAVAHADYALRADGFEGRVAMTMGGKNMTMTELQSGRRVGDCASERLSASPAGL